MSKLLKYREYYSTIIFDIFFLLLLIYITNGIVELSTVSTIEQNQNICLPIIMYHQVKNTNLGKDIISTSEFESDLKYLSEHNYTTITMTQLIDFVYKGEPLPENPIVLSFDDGYLSTYENVFPLLKKYNMKIVLSIIGKSTDDFSLVSNQDVEYGHLTWEHIYEMTESNLVEIQNHSYNLHRISTSRYGSSQMPSESFSQYENILSEDICLLQDKITAVTNITPNTYAYPYGKYNNNTNVILEKLGFKASLSVTYGVNLISRENPKNLFGLKRICRAHNQSIEKVIKEGMETLKFIKE